MRIWVGLIPATFHRPFRMQYWHHDQYAVEYSALAGLRIWIS